MRVRIRACGAIASVVAIVAFTSAARAVELYPESPPPRVLVVVAPPPVRQVLVAPPPPAVETTTSAGSMLVLGGGIGGLILLGADGALAPLGHVHVGLFADAAEFGLRVGFAPFAATITNADATRSELGLYTADATFTYRFLPRSDVHPVVGAGLGAVIAAEATERARVGLGVSLRLGVELDLHVDDARIGAGLDAIATQVAAAEERFPWALGTSIGASAHVDLRL